MMTLYYFAGTVSTVSVALSLVMSIADPELARNDFCEDV